MVVFALVAVTALGFLTTALSATSVARLEGVAKNLGQERLEAMRNLPFHIAATVSTAPDLLDTYYTSTSTPAPSTSSSGYVSSTGARDTSQGDPATGAFYRRVFAAGSVPGYPAFAERVSTQFMKDASAALADTAFISTSTALDGLPPSTTVSVRVTMMWQANGRSKTSTVYSQIAEAASKPPLVTLQARLEMVRFSGLLPSNRELVVDAGSLSLDGSLSSSTSASAVALGTSSSIAGASRSDGAKATSIAPPSVTTALSDGQGPKQLNDGADRVVELSNSAVSGVAASALDGQPGAGTSAAQVVSQLQGAGGFGSPDLTLGVSNRPDTTTRLGLLGAGVQLKSPSCGGGCTAVEGKGYLASVGGASHSATAAMTGRVNGTFSLFPTLQSPEGILKVTLASFTASCDSRAGSSPAASAAMTFAGTVAHRTYDPTVTDPAARYGYSTPVAISSGSSTDPLAAINLGTTLVGVTGNGLPLVLGDYVQSWSSLTSGAITAGKQLAANGSSVSLAMPGVLTVASKPLRAEPESTVGLQLGVASCVAGDVR